jgi:periplasmic protein CpxP/Spy
MNLNSIRIAIVASTLGLAAIAPTATWALTPAAPPKTSQTTTKEESPAATTGKIQISPDQMKKINAIKSDRNKKILAVLTPAQLAKFSDEVKKDEQKLKAALESANLSKEQKVKIVTIANKSNQEIAAVLTPEQRKQVQELQQAQTKKK